MSTSVVPAAGPASAPGPACAAKSGGASVTGSGSSASSCAPSGPYFAPECFGLKSLKCFSCTWRENEEALDNMRCTHTPLPDCIPVPTAYSVVRWPDETSLPKGLVSEVRNKRKWRDPVSRDFVDLPPLWFRVECGCIEFYAVDRALFPCKQADSRCLKDSGISKFSLRGRLFLKVDSCLVDHLSRVIEFSKKATNVDRALVSCKAQLKKLEDKEFVSFLSGEWESVQQGTRKDLAAIRDEVLKTAEYILKVGGREAAEDLWRAMGAHCGFTVQGSSLTTQALEAGPDIPSELFNDYFWLDVTEKSKKPFSLTGDEAAEFRTDQITGRHRQIHYRYVGPRKRSVKFEFQLAPGVVLRETESIENNKTLNTLQRIAWLLQEFPEDRIRMFVESVGEDTAKKLGYGRSSLIRKDGNTSILCALEFIRNGFLGSLMYLGTVQTKDLREAILYSADARRLRNSLTAQLVSVRPELINEVTKLNGIYLKICKAAEHCFKLKQLTRSSASNGLPEADTLLRIMFELDTKRDKTDEEVLILAFLGLSYFLGLRSGEMGKMRCLFFKNDDLGDYMMIVEDGGRLCFGSTSCKTQKNQMKSIPLPLWLERWVRDYHEVRPRFMHGEEHTGMWTTATGLPVHSSIRGVSGKKGFNFDYMKKILESHFSLDYICDYTDLRSIFFDGSGEDCHGSMLNLFARSQHLLSKKRPRYSDETSPNLVDKQGIIDAMAELYKSKSQREYTNKCKNFVFYILERLDTVKTFLWEEWGR